MLKFDFKLICGISQFLIRFSNYFTFPPRAAYIWRNNTIKSISTTIQKCNNKNQWNKNYTFHGVGGGCVLYSAAFTLNFFKKSDKSKETPDDKLINAIKQSILCIQQEDYDKADEVLRTALQMAENLNSRHEIITYIYDLMASVAMEQQQYKKAEKLFANARKRHLDSGESEDSPQILRISSKLAHMAQLQGDMDAALQGFTWTLMKLEEILKQMPDKDKDIQELYGLTKNWFGELLLKLGKHVEAKKMFEQAYDCLMDVYGTANEACVTVLNNLSVACVKLDDLAEAERNLLLALELINGLDNTTQEGILHANLGLIYLRQELVSEAKNACLLAWRSGKRSKNLDAIEQAEYCFNEIKLFMHQQEQ